jgi:hypothetical protein
MQVIGQLRIAAMPDFGFRRRVEGERRISWVGKLYLLVKFEIWMWKRRHGFSFRLSERGRPKAGGQFDEGGFGDLEFAGDAVEGEALGAQFDETLADVF